jgi:hypothetical protein
MPKADGDSAEANESTIEMKSINYWSDIKNLIYSSHDYSLSNEQFRELLNQLVKK